MVPFRVLSLLLLLLLLCLIILPPRRVVKVLLLDLFVAVELFIGSGLYFCTRYGLPVLQRRSEPRSGL